MTAPSEDVYATEVARLLDLKATPGAHLSTPELLRLQRREAAQQGRVDRAEQDMVESVEAAESVWAGVMAPRNLPSHQLWDLRS